MDNGQFQELLWCTAHSEGYSCPGYRKRQQHRAAHAPEPQNHALHGMHARHLRSPCRSCVASQPRRSPGSPTALLMPHRLMALSYTSTAAGRRAASSSSMPQYISSLNKIAPACLQGACRLVVGTSEGVKSGPAVLRQTALDVPCTTEVVAAPDCLACSCLARAAINEWRCCGTRSSSLAPPHLHASTICCHSASEGSQPLGLCGKLTTTILAPLPSSRSRRSRRATSKCSRPRSSLHPGGGRALLIVYFWLCKDTEVTTCSQVMCMSTLGASSMRATQLAALSPCC